MARRQEGGTLQVVSKELKGHQRLRQCGFVPQIILIFVLPVGKRAPCQLGSAGTTSKSYENSAPNLTERITLHVIIDSNNNVKVQKTSDTISCK